MSEITLIYTSVTRELIPKYESRQPPLVYLARASQSLLHFGAPCQLIVTKRVTKTSPLLYPMTQWQKRCSQWSFLSLVGFSKARTQRDLPFSLPLNPGTLSGASHETKALPSSISRAVLIKPSRVRLLRRTAPYRGSFGRIVASSFCILPASRQFKFTCAVS
jgi:hypothetical protein